MQFGILGTGMVGQTLATKLAELGHAVMMGARSQEHKAAQAWRAKTERAQAGTFGDAAAFGQLVIKLHARRVFSGRSSIRKPQRPCRESAD